MANITKPLIVYIPDTRGVQVSPFGLGNLKIGPGVYTYSRLPGRPYKAALGIPVSRPTLDGVYPLDSQPGPLPRDLGIYRGTCPGSSPECETICYAARPVQEAGAVAAMWARNSVTPDVPEIPEDAKLIRLHVSGDFDSVEYVHNWFVRLLHRPDVLCWVYTRSWRVPELLPALEDLRALSNVQMFASMDVSIAEMPPDGWRRAWIDGDPRAGVIHKLDAHDDLQDLFRDFETQRTADGAKALICPEETKHVKNCEECGFCFRGTRNDVVFLKH